MEIFDTIAVLQHSGEVEICTFTANTKNKGMLALQAYSVRNYCKLRLNPQNLSLKNPTETHKNAVLYIAA